MRLNDKTKRNDETGRKLIKAIKARERLDGTQTTPRHKDIDRNMRHEPVHAAYALATCLTAALIAITNTPPRIRKSNG